MRFFKWVIWLSVALHLTWGACLIVDPAAERVTAIDLGFHAAGVPVLGMGVTYIAVACIAIYGLWTDNGDLGSRTRATFAMVPQQIALYMSAWGALTAMVASTFADGAIRPRAFIVADQSIHPFMAIMHTIAIMEPYWIGHYERVRAWIRHKR